MKKIIIFGSSGRLGSYLTKHLGKNNLIFPINRDKRNKYYANLYEEVEVDKLIKKIDPNIIINCAASTNVNKCINDYNYGYKGNVLIPHNIVKSLKSCNKKIHLIHFSTDQVYNKKKIKKSLEYEVNISNNYSKTKFYGEREIKKIKNYTIIRTNFFGKLSSFKHKSFSDFIINNLKMRKKMNMANNIYYNPIHISFLIKYINLIIKKNIKGTYNIGSDEIISKYDFAKKIAEFYSLDSKLICKYKSILSHHKRPLNTSVNTNKFKNKILIDAPKLVKMLGTDNFI